MTSVQRASLHRDVVVRLRDGRYWRCRRSFPTQIDHRRTRAVGSVIGVVALLLALVLGLLIWTSYGVFATQQTESQTLGLSTLQLDYLLEQYGPEAIPGRLGVRATRAPLARALFRRQ